MRKPSADYGMYYWWWLRDINHILRYQWMNPELKAHLEAAKTFIIKHYTDDIEAYEALPDAQP